MLMVSAVESSLCTKRIIYKVKDTFHRTKSNYNRVNVRFLFACENYVGIIMGNVHDRSSGAWNRVKVTTMGSNPSDHILLFHVKGFWDNHYLYWGSKL